MENSIAKVIRIIGIIEIFAGLFLGLYFGKSTTMDEYLDDYTTTINWSVAFIWIGAGVVSGMLLYGFSEVIELIHNINKKLGNDTESNNPETKEVYTRQEASKLYEQSISDK